MKKVVIIAGSILAIIIIGILLINSQEKNTEVTKKQTKVGVVLNGSIQDQSWSQSHYEAMEKSAQSLNLEVVYEANVPQDETCLEVMEKMINDGCKIIVCNSFGFGEWEMEMAEKYSDTFFLHASGTEERSNLSTYFGRIYQMRYLSGIVAGMQTETNEIGYVAAFAIPEVNRGINAFTLGVRAVNPDAVVYVEWCDSWTDEQKTEDATNALLDNHNIDVLAMHTDSLVPLKIAEEKGIWSIGYNMDNSTNFPNTYLTAPVWQWQNFYEPRILECLQGKFVGKHYWEGVDTGMVSLAPFTENVKSGIVEVVEQERQRLQSGTFDVFYGPITDIEGNVRIKEGESMSDEAMLNDFDWYVEGVQMNEKE